MFALIVMANLLFGLLAVAMFKGTFQACQGDAFDSLTQDQKNLVTYPVPYAELTAEQRSWGGAVSVMAGAAAGDGSTSNSTLVIERLSYPGRTSHAVCDWLGAEWGDTVPSNFDNIIASMITLFEISTTGKVRRSQIGRCSWYTHAHKPPHPHAQTDRQSQRDTDRDT